MVNFPDNYIKGIIRTNNNSYSNIKKELKRYSELHDFNQEETTYYFILKLIKNREFFKLDLKVYDELLYDAIYWSSKEEYKKKTRAKTAKDVKSQKNVNKYIQLQKEMLKLTYEENKEKTFLIDEILVKYFSLFHELASIKRDRR